MSYVHKLAKQVMDHRTLMQIFDEHADRHPMREAFVIYNQAGHRFSYSFQEMQHQSLFLAASFLRLGWKRGHRVGLLVPDRVEFLISYMAMFRIGVNVILLPSYGKKADEIIHLLRMTKSQRIVACASEDASFNTSLTEGLLGVCESSQVVWIDAENAAGISKDGYMHYTDLLESGKALDVKYVLKEQNQVQMDDPAFVVFTSGSTGQPKGVQISNMVTVNGPRNSGVHGYGIELDNQCQPSKCRLFNNRPFYSGGNQTLGMVFVFSLGYTLVTAPPLGSEKECETKYILKILENEKCTNAYMLPYVAKNMIYYLQLCKYDLESLKSLYTVGEPFHNSLFVKLKSTLPRCTFFDVYGLTEIWESATQIFDQDIQLNEYNELDILPNHEIKIIDDELKIVPVGEVGEICIRSPFRFLEYIENPKATAEVLSPTGWYRTGDMGFLNKRKKLIVLGRRCFMIQRGKANIFPPEVEKVLLDYPDVVDVVVVGNVEESNEILCASVVPEKGSVLETDTRHFEEWINQQFAGNERRISLKPNHFHVMDVFPKTDAGKIDRNAIRHTVSQGLAC